MTQGGHDICASKPPATGTLFFDIRPGTSPCRWTLAVDAGVSVGRPERPTLFGGAALGGALQAAERVCGGQLLWASAHFLNRAALGDTLTYAVESLVRGRRVEQVRVAGFVDELPILTVTVALGIGEGGQTLSLRPPPRIVEPEACPPRGHWRGLRHGLHDRLEVRQIPLQLEARSELALWVRPREVVDMDVGLLAVIGDLLPAVFWQAAPQYLGGSSLDNTIRIQAPPAGRSDWMLCHLSADGIGSDVGHGSMSIFDRQGRLIATCSQSLLLRSAPGKEPMPRSLSATANARNVKDPTCRDH